MKSGRNAVPAAIRPIFKPSSFTHIVSCHHVLGYVEGDLRASAQSAERVDDRALRVEDRFEGDRSARSDPTFETRGGGLRKFIEKLTLKSGGSAEQGIDHLIFAHRAQDGAKVAAVEKGEVFEIDKLFRQGFPPDRLDLEG